MFQFVKQTQELFLLVYRLTLQNRICEVKSFQVKGCCRFQMSYNKVLINLERSIFTEDLSLIFPVQTSLSFNK